MEIFRELLESYSNTSQTRGPKLAEFSNSRFLLLLFTPKLAVLGSTNSRFVPSPRLTNKAQATRL